MKYGWLECEVSDTPFLDDSQVLSFVLADDTNVSLFIHKNTDDIEGGAGGVSWVETEILVREDAAILVRLLLKTHQVDEMVYWIHPHHLRTEFKRRRPRRLRTEF